MRTFKIENLGQRLRVQCTRGFTSGLVNAAVLRAREGLATTIVVENARMAADTRDAVGRVSLPLVEVVSLDQFCDPIAWHGREFVAPVLFDNQALIALAVEVASFRAHEFDRRRAAVRRLEKLRAEVDSIERALASGES